MALITSSVPGTWQDLQRETARILSECGLTVELEKVIRTVRGDVEIDVYAEEEVDGRRYVALVECKHWKARLPQSVIHAFRTVVADSGANIGYVIATGGFQIGAFSTSAMTNVRLVTWEELQTEFERSWVEHYCVPLLTERLRPLFPLMRGLRGNRVATSGPRGVRVFTLSEIDRREFEALAEECREFGYLIAHRFTRFPFSALTESGELPALPVRYSRRGLDAVPAAVLDAASYREFVGAALEYGEGCIQRFRDILGRGVL